MGISYVIVDASNSHIDSILQRKLWTFKYFITQFEFVQSKASDDS